MSVGQMKALVKIYTASCLVVFGFFVVLHLPWELLPFSDGVNITIVGAALIAFVGCYIYYFYRREGFDFGWFLANRGGFFILGTGILGLTTLVCGLVIIAAPGYFVPAFEQGALPFGIAIVSLFWLALIYMFGYLAIGMLARVVASSRRFSLSNIAVNGLISLVCLGLATLFFSLFLEVLNDILMRIGIDSHWTAIWIFVGGIALAGVGFGVWKEPSYHLDDEKPSGDKARD